MIKFPGLSVFADNPGDNSQQNIIGYAVVQLDVSLAVEKEPFPVKWEELIRRQLWTSA